MRKMLFFALAMAWGLRMHAQDSLAFHFTFNHMALSVKDENASVAFYTTLFQFTEITNRSKLEGIRWLSLSEGKELHLISRLKDPVTINKAVHLSFATQQFDAFLQRLDAMHLSYSDWPGAMHSINKRADGVKQVYFQDPDGYWIEVNNGYAAAPSAEQVKNEVWQLEENYWKYVKTKDLKSYLTLWDDQFIGYPANNTIGGKAHITDWITALYKDNTRNFNYELIRKVENVFGDLVIVFYDVNYLWTNNKNEVVERVQNKIIHTWKKTGAGWLIIGGMGAKKL